VVREQLFLKFGKELAHQAMHNHDNCVNARVVHKLSIQTPENYLVFQYLNEIAKAYGLDWKAEFAPEPVKIETSNLTMQFPAPPMGGTPIPGPSPTQLMFPTPPTGLSPAPSSTPMFPDPPRSTPPPSSGPSYNDVPVPDFNMNGMPGGALGNGNSNGSANLNLPTPPSFPTTSSGFPQVPNNSSFPSVPSNSGPSNSDKLEFPSPPGTTKSSSSNLSNFDFPTPPGESSSSGDSGVPDFDELTARFEKLKKRDS